MALRQDIQREKQALSPAAGVWGLLALYTMYASARRAARGGRQIVQKKPEGWSNLLGGSTDAVLTATPAAGIAALLGAAGKLRGLGVLGRLGSALKRIGEPVGRVVGRTGSVLLHPVSKVTGWRPGQLAKELTGGLGLSVGGEMVGLGAEALAGHPPTREQVTQSVLPAVVKERLTKDSSESTMARDNKLMEKQAIEPLSMLFGALALYGAYSGGKRALKGVDQVASGREGGWGNLAMGLGEGALSLAIPGGSKLLGTLGKVRGLGALAGAGKAVGRVENVMNTGITRFGGGLLKPVSKLTGWRPGEGAKNWAGFLAADPVLQGAGSVLGANKPTMGMGRSSIPGMSMMPTTIKRIDPTFGMQPMNMPQGIY